MQSGDAVFFHGSGFLDWSIEYATRSPWSHVAILHEQLPSGEWSLIQAHSHGVVRDTPETPSRFNPVVQAGTYEIVPAPPGVDRVKTIEFMLSQVGRKYGFITIASIAVTLWTPQFINVMLPCTWICSAVAAQAWAWGGWKQQWCDIYQVSPGQFYAAAKPAPTHG